MSASPKEEQIVDYERRLMKAERMANRAMCMLLSITSKIIDLHELKTDIPSEKFRVLSLDLALAWAAAEKWKRYLEKNGLDGFAQKIN